MAKQTEDIKLTVKSLFPKHDYTKQYSRLSIVQYSIGNEPTLYQALKNVPPKIPINNTSYWKPLTPVNTVNKAKKEPDYLCFTANNDNTGFCFYVNALKEFPDCPISLEYSTDKVNWQTLNFTSSSWTDEDMYKSFVSDFIGFDLRGDSVYFRGNNLDGTANVYLDSNNPIPVFYTFLASADFLTNNIYPKENNTFAVSGDLQTIVDATGQDKEHGCFAFLFFTLYSETGVLITSTPDLTATTLQPCKYSMLFAGQTLITQPANMPKFTAIDLPTIQHLSVANVEFGCFGGMYGGCTSLQRPAEFNIKVESVDDVNSPILQNSSLNGDNPVMNILAISAHCDDMYKDTTFDITDDDGLTIKGFDNIVFPIMFGDDPFLDLARVYGSDLAGILGTYVGFNEVSIYLHQDTTRFKIESKDPTKTGSTINYEDVAPNGIGYIRYDIPYDRGRTLKLAPVDINDTHYAYLAESTDGVNWTKLENIRSVGATPTWVEIPMPTTSRHYSVILEDM